MPLIVSRSVRRHASLCTRVDIRAYLGSNVRRLRLKKGWSQEDYADRAGICRTYVSEIERGAWNPTIIVVEKLARPLGEGARSFG